MTSNETAAAGRGRGMGTLRALAASAVPAETRAATAADAIRRSADLNCFIGFDPERAMAEAVRADGAGKAARQAPLRGVPLAVKDNIDYAGTPTSAGTPALAASIATATAPALQRLLDAGACVLGKANMHELAFGVTSRNAAFGFVRNPLDPSRSAGGSSGGCAAAVAAGIVPAALGTDTGGSVRVPAAFCGIVGFRPTTGRYGDAGVIPLAASRDTIGPMATSVEDVALMDAILAGEPARLPGVPPPTLGVPRGFLTGDLDPQVERSWNAALDTLRKAGIRLVDVGVPGLWDLIDATSALVTRYELRRDLPGRILPRSPGLSAREFVASIASPDVRGLMEMVLQDAGAPGETDYLHARRELLPRMRNLLEAAFRSNGLDAWAFPTVPMPAFTLQDDREVELNGVRRPLFMTTVRNLQQASLIGMPSLSLPLPREPGALPVGLCIEGLPGQDRRTLAVASLLEGCLAESATR